MVLAMTLVDLGLFGFGLNPAIRPALQDLEPPVIGRLREGLPPEGRALGLGEELPPGVLMRFGLSDPRNYDSVELDRSLAWFDPIYEPSGSVGRAAARHLGVGVSEVATACAIRASMRSWPRLPRPAGTFDRVEKVGPRLDRLARRPAVGRAGRPKAGSSWTGADDRGRAVIRLRTDAPGRVPVRETWDPGWTAQLDGRPLTVVPGPGPFS